MKWRPAAHSFAGDNPDPLTAAVVHTFRSRDGRDMDRYALLPPLRRDPDDGREDPRSDHDPKLSPSIGGARR